MKPKRAEQATMATSRGMRTIPSIEMVSNIANGTTDTNTTSPHKKALNGVFLMAPATMQTGLGSKATRSRAMSRIPIKTINERTAKTHDQPSQSSFNTEARDWERSEALI